LYGTSLAIPRKNFPKIWEPIPYHLEHIPEYSSCRQRVYLASTSSSRSVGAGSCRRGTFMAQGRKMKGGMEARESVYHSDHIVFRVSCRPTPSEQGKGLVLRGILIHGSLFVVSLRPARHACPHRQHRKETKKHGSSLFTGATWHDSRAI